MLAAYQETSTTVVEGLFIEYDERSISEPFLRDES